MNCMTGHKKNIFQQLMQIRKLVLQEHLSSTNHTKYASSDGKPIKSKTTLRVLIVNMNDTADTGSRNINLLQSKTTDVRKVARL